MKPRSLKMSKELEASLRARAKAKGVSDSFVMREALVDASRAIGIAAANVVTILHPDLIVLGGGVAEIGPLLTDTVRQVIRERVGMFPTDNVRVESFPAG